MRQGRYDAPIIPILFHAMRRDHRTDVDPWADIAHLTIRIGSCSPVSSLAQELLRLRIQDVDFGELRSREIHKIILEKVVELCGAIDIWRREDCPFVGVITFESQYWQKMRVGGATYPNIEGIFTNLPCAKAL